MPYTTHDTMANPEKLTHDEMFKVLPLEVMKVMIQSLAPSTTDVAIMMEKELHKKVDSMVNMQHETIVRNAYEKQFPLNSKFGPSLISPQEKFKQEKQSHGTFATSLISPTQEVVDLSADSLSSDDELQAGTSPQQHTCTQIKNKKRRRNTTARVRKTTGLKKSSKTKS